MGNARQAIRDIYKLVSQESYFDCTCKITERSIKIRFPHIEESVRRKGEVEEFLTNFCSSFYFSLVQHDISKIF